MKTIIWDYLKKKIAVSNNEAQIYAYVQHEWINAETFWNAKALVVRDTVNATVVAGKVPEFKYYKVKKEII
jgi:hypothetical protein